MTHLSKYLATAALLATLGAAVAQTPPPARVAPPAAQGPMAGPHHGRFDPARAQERIERRFAYLRQKLQLSPAQEGNWNNWIAAMRPTGPLQRPDPEEMMRLTTPERIDRMRALRTERMARMDRRMEATKGFYATLNAAQKQVFDAESARLLAQRGQRGHRGGHHMGGGRMGGGDPMGGMMPRSMVPGAPGAPRN